MKHKRIPVLTTLIWMGILVLLGTTVLAQSSASFDLSWHVIAGGGGPSASASYRVNGTVGQGIIKPAHAASASYGLDSGYWPGGSANRALYLPLILRN